MRQCFVWIGFYFSLSRRGPDNMEAKFCRYWSDMEGSQDVTVRPLTCLNSLEAEHCKKVKRNTKGCKTNFPYFSCLISILFVKLNIPHSIQRGTAKFVLMRFYLKYWYWCNPIYFWKNTRVWKKWVLLDQHYKQWLQPFLMTNDNKALSQQMKSERKDYRTPLTSVKNQSSRNHRKDQWHYFSAFMFYCIYFWLIRDIFMH